MKLAIMSDVHLEFGSMHVVNEHNCDVLILAGDILIARTLEQTAAASHTEAAENREMYTSFVRQCVQEFKHVVAIAGNHEFYNGKFVQTLSTLRQFYNTQGVHFLENDCVELEGYKFCGCTLWTDFNNNPIVAWDAKRFVNDFKKITDDTGIHYTKLRPESVQQRNRESRYWLQSVVDQRSVVVTHMAPSERSVYEKYRGDLLNHYYYSDMTQIIEHGQPRLWIHGHMHDPSDYQLYNTRVVCNPRGYVGYQHTDGYSYKVIEV